MYERFMELLSTPRLDITVGDEMFLALFGIGHLVLVIGLFILGMYLYHDVYTHNKRKKK